MELGLVRMLIGGYQEPPGGPLVPKARDPFYPDNVRKYPKVEVYLSANRAISFVSLVSCVLDNATHWDLQKEIELDFLNCADNAAADVSNELHEVVIIETGDRYAVSAPER
jgi:hypothetical protein